MKPTVLLVFALTLFIFLPSSVAFAQCKCPEKDSVTTAFEKFDYIFIGQVESVGRNPVKPNQSEVRFLVQRQIKSPDVLPTSKIYIYTPDTKEQCGYDFKSGMDYLVYATGNFAYLKTDSCTRTEILDRALEEQTHIQALADRAAKSAGTSSPK